MSKGPRAKFTDPGARRRDTTLWAIAHAPKDSLTCAERCVLFVLESFVAAKDRDSGICWPALRTIADGAGVDERTARRALRSLEAKGWLETTPHGDRGWQASNSYRVTPPADEPDAPASNEPAELH